MLKAQMQLRFEPARPLAQPVAKHDYEPAIKKRRSTNGQRGCRACHRISDQ
jgi:hypothetical protein